MYQGRISAPTGGFTFSSAWWKIATGSPTGPFEIYDVVGMMTPYNLGKDSADPVQREFAEILKRDYIDKGYLGKGSGRGFYTYE